MMPTKVVDYCAILRVPRVMDRAMSTVKRVLLTIFGLMTLDGVQLHVQQDTLFQEKYAHMFQN